MFAEMEGDDAACKLDVMLVYEVYTEHRAMMLYPINLLRNLARVQASGPIPWCLCHRGLSRCLESHSNLLPSQARTPLLALVDVDMLLGSRLYQDLRANPIFSQQIVKGANAKAAYVLPAFETYGETHEAAALADLRRQRPRRPIYPRSA